MPGQRDKKRRSLSAYIWETDKEVLKRVAKENDMTLTEVIEFLIDELNNKDKKNDSKTKLRKAVLKWKNKQ
tara:strand:+ start:3776 stop:3988 length:213 start_codon:yes stop_codon:yes gene_type:complete